MAKRPRVRGDTRASTSTSRKNGIDASRAHFDLLVDEDMGRRRHQPSPVNAIAPARVSERASSLQAHRQRTGSQNPAPAQTQAPSPKSRPADVLPEDIKRRFVATGNAYYFPDGTRAFVDRSDRLTTRGENPEVIASLAAIAKARDWREITLSGTRRFKQEMWVAARLAGLEVRGYTPAPNAEARLVREIARRTQQAPDRSAPTAAFEKPSGAEEPRHWRGRLVDHGPAPYQHKPKAGASYFVRIDTPRGTKDIWGIDLARAMRDALSRPERGDVVELRRVGQDPVSVRSVQRDDDGTFSMEATLDTHRNRWVVEKQDFLKDRAQAAQLVRDGTVSAKAATARHPELSGTYLQLRAAELVARRLQHPKDRAQFVDIVRNALADSIARGEPMPTVEVRERTHLPPRSRTAHRAPAPERG